MIIEAELVVIGGGMAGAAAAVEAARAGAHTLLISGAVGATELGSGLVDFVVAPSASRALSSGAPSSVSGGIASDLCLQAQADDHPLAAWRDDVDRLLVDALDLLDRLTPGQGFQRSSEHTAWCLASSSGALRRAHVVPASHLVGELRAWQGARVGVAHLTGLRQHDGRSASLLLRQSCARVAALQGIVPITVTLPFLCRARDQHLSDVAVARLLDDMQAQDALARAIADSLQASSEIDLLLLPPVLGLERTQEALFRLQAIAGLPMAEMISSGGGVPGLRLARAMQRGLSQQGVEQLAGRVVGLHLGQGTRIELDCDSAGSRSALRVRARDVILATGHLIGGGLRLDPFLREALGDLSVWLNRRVLCRAGAADLISPQRRASHALLQAGLRVDSQHRVLAADARPVHPRLRAAGSVVVGGGLQQMGIALINGMLAARSMLAAQQGAPTLTRR